MAQNASNPSPLDSVYKLKEGEPVPDFFRPARLKVVPPQLQPEKQKPEKLKKSPKSKPKKKRVSSETSSVSDSESSSEKQKRKKKAKKKKEKQKKEKQNKERIKKEKKATKPSPSKESEARTVVRGNENALENNNVNVVALDEAAQAIENPILPEPQPVPAHDAIVGGGKCDDETVKSVPNDPNPPQFLNAMEIVLVEEEAKFVRENSTRPIPVPPNEVIDLDAIDEIPEPRNEKKRKETKPARPKREGSAKRRDDEKLFQLKEGAQTPLFFLSPKEKQERLKRLQEEAVNVDNAPTDPTTPTTTPEMTRELRKDAKESKERTPSGRPQREVAKRRVEGAGTRGVEGAGTRGEGDETPLFFLPLKEKQERIKKQQVQKIMEEVRMMMCVFFVVVFFVVVFFFVSFFKISFSLLLGFCELNLICRMRSEGAK
jgi:hypothetical protein